MELYRNLKDYRRMSSVFKEKSSPKGASQAVGNARSSANSSGCWKTPGTKVSGSVISPESLSDILLMVFFFMVFSMDKIKCPHCGSINQDVTEQDTCWNCGKPLSASAAVPAASAVSDTGVDSGGQRLKTQPTLEERVAARKEERIASRRANPAVPIVIALTILLIIILIYFLFFRHR